MKPLKRWVESHGYFLFSIVLCLLTSVQFVEMCDGNCESLRSGIVKLFVTIPIIGILLDRITKTANPDEKLLYKIVGAVLMVAIVELLSIGMGLGIIGTFRNWLKYEIFKKSPLTLIAILVITFLVFHSDDTRKAKKRAK